MELRFYSFTNFMLSGIQKGIQSAHVIADLEIEYRDQYLSEIEQNLVIDHGDKCTIAETRYMDYYTDWAENYKTLIVLDGGNHKMLEDLFSTFCDFNSTAEARDDFFEYPFSIFREDQQSLNCAATAVGIVLPESIYNAAAIFRSNPEMPFDDVAVELAGGTTKFFTYSPEEVKLIMLLAGARLASN